MPAAAPSTSPSTPFAARELNGEVLLQELEQLRDAQVGARHLLDCAVALKALKGARVSDAGARLKQLAGSRFQGQPALAGLLVKWSNRLRSEADVELLRGHLERLASASALIGAMWRVAERRKRGVE